LHKIEAGERKKFAPEAGHGNSASHETEAVGAAIIIPVVRGHGNGQGKSTSLDGAGKGRNKLTPHERLAEVTGLAEAIGLNVRHAGFARLNHIKPATLLGSGKVEDVKALLLTSGASLVIIDHPLSPVQQRNLETAWQAKVLDRTGLILEIFGRRAQTKEGRLQVELAHLTYQKSRLVRSWTHLERQRGGFGFLGGPGETQIEADRRVIGERIDAIQNDLEVVKRTRALHRKRRMENETPVAVLAGYTNAGKSTLFNALTGAGVVAKDMLFATLDPTLRKVQLGHGGAFILSDTVGFISNLPSELVAAFRATLEEIPKAELVLHVRDMASPSAASQKDDVEAVLAGLGFDARNGNGSLIEVWNKTDLLSPDDVAALHNQAGRCNPPAFMVSARTGEGISELLAYIRQRLTAAHISRDVVVDQGNGPLINWLYKNTEVVDRRDYHDGSLHFCVRLAPNRSVQLDRRLSRHYR
jgi:GTP-binding protein HflX